MSIRQRPIFWLTVAFVVLVGGFSILWGALGSKTIVAAYNGESYGVLNKAVARSRAKEPETRNVEYYQTRAQVAFTRGVMVLTAGYLLTIALIRRRAVFHRIGRFITEPAAANDLALFRIALFLCLIFARYPADSLFASALPLELRSPPPGTQWAVKYLPIFDHDTVRVGYVVHQVLCWMALFGLFTRVSVTLAAIVGLYILGVPQMYGKITHYHHLAWFPLLLVFSRCGDALSIDAIFKAFKRADLGVIDPPAPSILYGLPLRLAAVLIGLLYFFPGWYKLWDGGFAWVYTDQLTYRMYRAWMLSSIPAIRPDAIPLSSQFGAASAVLFELSFIVMILWTTTRVAIAAVGQMFHFGTWYLMSIPFWTLQVCYAALIPWQTLFNAIGAKLFGEPLYVLYDGNCKLCRRTIATLNAFDLLRRVTYINALDRAAIKDAGLDWLDSMDLYREMHAVRGREKWAGYDAYRKIAQRHVLLWPVLPLLYLPPVPAIGAAIYTKVANSRTCSIRREVTPLVVTDAPRLPWALLTVGAILIAANTERGLRKAADSWPVSCYPTFSELATPEATLLRIEAIGATGERTKVERIGWRAGFPPGTFEGLSRRLVEAKPSPKREHSLNALWHVFAVKAPELANVTKVQFFEDRISVIPEDNKKLLSRKLLHELDVPGSTTVTTR